MTRTLTQIALILFSLIASIPAWPQSASPSVKLQGRATQKSIKLRWAPDSPLLWHFANKYGYTIERVMITVNGKTLDKPVRTVLNTIPLKPAREEIWDPYMDTDDYVAIAAQAIFGETFELTNDYTSDVIKVINKARELESRFSFALFSADQSIKAAELSGLYFEDETIAPGTRYVYRVYANIPPEILKVDTGFVYLGIQDYTPLPKVRDVRAEFDDHMAMISWDGALFDRLYSSYWVERSDDGRSFHKITERPVVNTFTGEKPNTKNIYKMDTLPENDKKYVYRVIGIDAFGENGPPSDTVSGAGRPAFTFAASIINHAITDDGKAALEWSFPLAGESLLRSFSLYRLHLDTKVLEEVTANIDRSTRAIKDESPRSTNYYVIRSTDRYGRFNNSFPYLVQLEDSIPPKAPVELTGRVDTLGRVFLNWKGNIEDDLAGYHVYKSNFTSDEFIQLPGPILKENSYVDTIKLNNLTEKIYYKVQAVDKRFNRSEFSTPVNLKKPDIMPPVPPVFTGIKSDSSGIHIFFQKSDSEDVLEHMLYRRTENEAEWTLIKVMNLTDTAKSYSDHAVEHRTKYAYTMLAVDDDNLESAPCEPISIKWMDPDPYPAIEDIYYIIDKTKRSIKLSWSYGHPSVDRFLIYKAVNDQPLRLYKSVEATVLEVNDGYTLSDDNVQYSIVASFKSGEKTRISRMLMIKI